MKTDINFTDLPNDIKYHIFTMNRSYHNKINQEYKDNKCRYDSVLDDLRFVHMWSDEPSQMLGYIEDVKLDIYEVEIDYY